MIAFLSKKMAMYICQNDDEADFEILAYGYDLLLQELLVNIIALLIALPFRMFFHTLLSILVYNLMRRNAGGMHAKYRIACIMTSIFTMFVPSYLFANTNAHIADRFILLLFIIDLVLLLLYAPADTPTMPVTTPQKRKAMKTASIYTLFLLFAAAYFFQNQLQSFSSLIIVISTIVCVLTHPLVYKLYGCEKSIKFTSEVS